MSTKHFKRIMVPLDGSTNAHKALEMAIKFHKIFNSEVYLLCVYNTDSSWSASVSYVLNEITSSTEEAMKSFAKEVAEKSKEFAVKSGVKQVNAYYQGGDPATTILKFSKKHEVDLIILGKRGLANAGKGLLGSISHKVLNKSACPIMVI